VLLVLLRLLLLSPKPALPSTPPRPVGATARGAWRRALLPRLRPLPSLLPLSSCAGSSAPTPAGGWRALAVVPYGMLRINLLDFVKKE